MDYGKIVESTYKWVSAKGAIWFAIFFLITLSIMTLIPLMIKQGIFFDEPSLPVVNVLYAFNAFVLFIGFFALVEFILKFNGFSTQKVTPGKLLDSAFLAVLYVWYTFIWNIHRPHRLIQLLSLFVCTLALFSLAFYNSSIVAFAVIIFGLLYLGFVVSNCVRLSFSYYIFYSRKLSIKHALLESWKMTEGRTTELLTAYVIGGVVVIVLGSVIVFIVGSVVSLILGSSFIPPVTYKLAILIGSLFASAFMLIGEQSFITEAYAQANIKHEIKQGVKRILTKRTLVSDHKHKLAKKKTTKKALKKVVKKKVVKKKATKKAKRR